MPITVTTGGPIAPAVARKPILGVIQEVCPVIGLRVPDAVFGSTRREHVELAALAIEMAERIARDTHDWKKLIAPAVLDGDGVSEAFDLPADYARMLKKGSVYLSTMPHSPLMGYPDPDDWLAFELQGFNGFVTGGWTIAGERIAVKPTAPEGSTVRFNYLSSLYAIDPEGYEKAFFTTDDDAFRLDNRVLKLGMIWQWRANKGFPYAEDMATYEEALSIQIGNDKGSNVLTVGGRRSARNISIAYPGALG